MNRDITDNDIAALKVDREIYLLERKANHMRVVIRLLENPITNSFGATPDIVDKLYMSESDIVREAARHIESLHNLFDPLVIEFNRVQSRLKDLKNLRQQYHEGNDILIAKLTGNPDD
ncbi:MAG: hypothetical protein BGP16_00970 [Sphingobium sp. 66-54]|nr:MAG: hypothetical protein BGP16_00970 [Sphingobium sp. 66-54]